MKKLYELKESNLKSSYDYNSKVRDIAVVELLFATGIRVSELCSLKFENISADFSRIRILSKRNKVRLIPITNIKTKNTLNSYFYLYKIQIQELFYHILKSVELT